FFVLSCRAPPSSTPFPYTTLFRSYNGEAIVILTSRDYAYQYNAAVSVQQMLNDVGINAKLDVYDWGTLLERRGDPGAWDIFFTGDRKSTRLNSSHVKISYAVFCLK